MERWWEKEKTRWRGGEQTRQLPPLAQFYQPPSESYSFHPSMSSSFLLQANSVPIQSPSEHSENASSCYISYAVHQSDRVWITLSMTPKSWCYQTLGLHGIAVTTSGSLRWDRVPLSRLDLREASLHVVLCYLCSIRTRLKILFTSCQMHESCQVIADIILIVFWVCSPKHCMPDSAHKLINTIWA